MTLPPPEPRSPIRVLVCEDQELVRVGYVTIFSAQADMEVVGEAQDGREAVEAARRLRPDVVVMDVRMPVLDGIEATRRIAGPDVGTPTKVLMVTTFNVDEYVYEALRAGASGFLLKDAPPGELVDGIRTIARGESLLAPTVTRALIGRYAERVRPTDASRPARDEVVRALTRRELEVLEQLAAGLSNAEIANVLVITPETVKTYVSRILAKLGLRDRVQAVVLAYRVGVVAATG
ncbi:DNA-binding NarL/FixJ family response regulator [Cellulosimicrobium cellulans]|uniref:response regulator n=1 Tax=Cellulosimicrobium cellulans TaxID=1710 RepID=UPI00195CCCAC|nr:response regulator transcription factor [Cellulosimicrobium cellulans]MBM7820565.1 DNA-binding NarL/FixJ family response regulator [Cellulosimicrobium cellulans]